MKKKTTIVCLIAAAAAVIAAIVLVLTYRDKMAELAEKAKAQAKTYGQKAKAQAKTYGEKAMEVGGKAVAQVKSYLREHQIPVR